jgi:hypothetical protein
MAMKNSKDLLSVIEGYIYRVGFILILLVELIKFLKWLISS